jgi:arsenate reductase-like glutaredoxin family protein
MCSVNIYWIKKCSVTEKWLENAAVTYELSITDQCHGVKL